MPDSSSRRGIRSCLLEWIPSSNSFVTARACWFQANFSIWVTVVMSYSFTNQTLAQLIHSFIHFISFHFISFHFISFHFISFHFISFHFISFHFISFHFISFHFISFHFISFHFISFIQQCHSARAARARTSDTRDTSQALHHKPPFLKRGEARVPPPRLSSSLNAYIYVTYVRWCSPCSSFCVFFSVFPSVVLRS